jgi:hypothetical protein
MKKLLLLAAAFATTSGAFAKNVVFRVDMTGQTISPNGVHVVGNFQNTDYQGGNDNENLKNWDPAAYEMTNGGSGNIYSIMLDMKGDMVYEYKIVNDNNWGAGEEKIPAACQVGGGNSNRWVYIPEGTDTITLPATLFGGSAEAGKTAIRLTVDMSLTAGVNANGVHVAGSFQGWNPAATKLVNYTGSGAFGGGKYTTLVYADTNSGMAKFKFINGNIWDNAESVPAECKVDNDGNRGVEVGVDAITYDVCYSKCGVCVVVPKYKITFNVDVESICGVDSVDVAGGLLDGSWGDGNKMTLVSNSKYTGSQMNIDSGSTVAYKYRYYKNGIRNWEQIATASGNRELVITSDTVLDANCFNTFSACNPRPASQTITFKADLSNEIPGDTVYLVLDYLGGWKNAVVMEAVAGQPGIFSKTITDVCNGTVYYYFINGSFTDESGATKNGEKFADTSDRACTKPNGVGGFQRELIRTTGDAQTLGFIFGSCKPIEATSIRENANLNNSMRIYPNPTSSYTVVEFNDNATKHNVSIMDITGRTVRTYNNYEFNAIRIERENLSSGTYFIQVVNNKNQVGTIKLMIE